MLQLRNEEEKDNLFIQAVYRSSREIELSYTNWHELQKQAFISMQSMAQLSEYKKKFPGALFQIIVYNKKNAGRFYTCENEEEIRLIDITLLPSYRSKGIGTTLLKKLIEKGNRVHKKVTLHVEPDNPALKLYERMSFVYVKTNGRHFYMERMPGNF